MAVIVHGCCCMNLRNAGFFLSWLSVALSVMALVKNMINFIPHVQAENKIYAFILIFLVFVFNSFLNGLFFRGIIMNKHLYLLPKLILEGIVLVALILWDVVLLILGLITISTHPSFFGTAVILLIFIGFGCWSFIIIYSLYEEIRLSKLLPTQLQAENGQMQMPPSYQQCSK